MPPACLRLGILLELFEPEISTAFGEPESHSIDYGILNDKNAYITARNPFW
jgi:hypothetical protein